MIEGIGIDLLEIQRIEKAYSHNRNFAKRVLTRREHSHFIKLTEYRQIEFLAGRFAAKEAFSKAYGTGIGSELSFMDIEILPNQQNRPILSTPIYEGRIHLSISHSENFVVAQVLLEK